jgi:hypothetical protein
MHKKPIYGGRIDSDHGNRGNNAWCIPEKGDINTKYSTEPYRIWIFFCSPDLSFLNLCNCKIK